MAKANKQSDVVTKTVAINTLHGFVETHVDRALQAIIAGKQAVSADPAKLAVAIQATLAKRGLTIRDSDAAAVKRIEADVKYLTYRDRLTVKNGKLVGAAPRSCKSVAASVAASQWDKPAKRTSKPAKRSKPEAKPASDATDNG